MTTAAATYVNFPMDAADPFTNESGELCVQVYTEIEVIDLENDEELFNGFFWNFIVVEGKEDQIDWGSNVENMVGCKVCGVEIEQHHCDNLKGQVLLNAQNSFAFAYQNF